MEKRARGEEKGAFTRQSRTKKGYLLWTEAGCFYRGSKDLMFFCIRFKSGVGGWLHGPKTGLTPGTVWSLAAG